MKGGVVWLFESLNISYKKVMDFKECINNNNLIMTDYTNFTIVDLVRTIYNKCGETFKYNDKMKELEQYIKGKKHILFILSDGMGSNIIDKLSEESILKKKKVKDIQTINPSTTGCAIPSILTGEYPEKHGMLGWLSYYRPKAIEYFPVLFQERRTGKDLSNFDIKSSDIYKTESVINNINRKSYALFPNYMKDSEFSKFALNTDNRLGYDSMSEAFKIFKTNIAKLSDETFTYMYLPDVDSKSHKFGVYSKEVENVINDIETELKQINIEENIEIIITADHGQTNVTEKGLKIDLEKYNEFFYALPGIDSGTATYYIKEDKNEEFEKRFKLDFKDKMFLFKTEELVENKVFGPTELSDYMKSNIGEYISICKKGIYLINCEEDDEVLNNLKGTHSGFSREEIIVPLIVIN